MGRRAVFSDLLDTRAGTHIERACRPVVDYEGYAAEARERCKHADERTVLEALNKLSVSPITRR